MHEHSALGPFALGDTAPFLCAADFLQSQEVRVEDSRELPRVEEVCKSGCLCAEDTGAEADAGVVGGHLVDGLPPYNLPFQEADEVIEDSAVEDGQVGQEVQQEVDLLLGRDG